MNLEKKRLAAIDIGSNAVRLLVSDVFPASTGSKDAIVAQKLKLYRIPVRLGEEAFNGNDISEKLLQQFLKAMRAFVLIMDIYGVDGYRACATSALREAGNGKAVIKRVLKETGIKIELIDGDEEAALILLNRLDDLQYIDRRFNHLYVDVGGGSTEISLVTQKGMGVSRSFKIGTVRLFKEQVKQSEWNDFATWLEKHIKGKRPLSIIGSGGNINKVFKRSNNKIGQPLMFDDLKKEHDLLETLSIEERIQIQNLNRDRAEVIVPALKIFLTVMEKTDIKQVFVPKIGLSDGIIREMYIKESTSS